MFSACKTVSLVAFMALLTAAPAFTQTPTEAETPEAKAAAPVAYVYVQTLKGVDVYDATAAGKLTLVKGSPFSTTGQMEGINGKYLFSVGTTNVHTYAIESNGAVGKQIGAINTQLYSGSECGNTDGAGAMLDHTGRHFYVQLFGALDGSENPACAAWQSYQVQADGELTFMDGLEYFSEVCSYGGCPNAGASTIPTVSGNDNLAYGVFPDWGDTTLFSTLALAPNGLLAINRSFSWTGPVPQPGEWNYFPVSVKADPTNHLAVLMYSEYESPYGNLGPFQLASYTISNGSGDISSTNTWENMPIPEIRNITGMSMSTSGKIVALFGYPGLQIFHFNGAEPITPYSKLLLPTVDIDQLAWDNDNHLYALSYSSGELYVYTATPTSIKEVPGSSYKVKNAYGIKGLIVVPKL
jgi:hypothetical protein